MLIGKNKNRPAILHARVYVWADKRGHTFHVYDYIMGDVQSSSIDLLKQKVVSRTFATSIPMECYD